MTLSTKKELKTNQYVKFSDIPQIYMLFPKMDQSDLDFRPTNHAPTTHSIDQSITQSIIRVET